MPPLLEESETQPRQNHSNVWTWIGEKQLIKNPVPSTHLFMGKCAKDLKSRFFFVVVLETWLICPREHKSSYFSSLRCLHINLGSRFVSVVLAYHVCARLILDFRTSNGDVFSGRLNEGLDGDAVLVVELVSILGGGRGGGRGRTPIWRRKEKQLLIIKAAIRKRCKDVDPQIDKGSHRQFTTLFSQQLFFSFEADLFFPQEEVGQTVLCFLFLVLELVLLYLLLSLCWRKLFYIYTWHSFTMRKKRNRFDDDDGSILVPRSNADWEINVPNIYDVRTRISEKNRCSSFSFHFPHWFLNRIRIFSEMVFIQRRALHKKLKKTQRRADPCPPIPTER